MKQLDSIGIFILFMRVLRWHGLFPSWEGDKGWVPFPVPRFHEDKFHEDKGREISVNISRITDLPTPQSPPKRGLSNLNFEVIMLR